MATVTGLTAARMLELADENIVDAELSGDDLVLTQRGGDTINVGSVKGPPGDDAATGDVEPTGDTTPIRTSDGRVKGADPTEDDDLTSKSYVDAAVDALDAADAILTGNLSSLNALVVGAEIGNAVNLNVYTTTGTFVQTSDSEAAAGTNYPVPVGGMLEVIANAASTIIFQRYVPMDGSGKFYQRRYAAAAWGAWKTYVSLEAADSGWIDVSASLVNFTKYSGTSLTKYRRVGDLVHLAGAISPANSTIATAIGTTSITAFLDLNALGIKPSNPYTFCVVCHGSSNDYWLPQMTGNSIGVSRYTPSAASTSTWLPFGFTYLI